MLVAVKVFLRVLEVDKTLARIKHLLKQTNKHLSTNSMKHPFKFLCSAAIASLLSMGCQKEKISPPVLNQATQYAHLSSLPNATPPKLKDLAQARAKEDYYGNEGRRSRFQSPTGYVTKEYTYAGVPHSKKTVTGGKTFILHGYGPRTYHTAKDMMDNNAGYLESSKSGGHYCPVMGAHFPIKWEHIYTTWDKKEVIKYSNWEHPTPPHLSETSGHFSRMSASNRQNIN